MGVCETGCKAGITCKRNGTIRRSEREVEAYGGKPLIIQCDVADAEQVEAAAEQAERELGEIDVWVNNAMASVFSSFKEITFDEFKRVTKVTYLGTIMEQKQH